MPASRIKNIILALLLATNLFLLMLVLPARRAEQQREQAVRLNLQTLFESYGVELDPTLVPEDRTLYPLVLEYSEPEQSAAATALLGSDAEEDTGVGHYTTVYRAAGGSCQFSRVGGFSAELTAQDSVSGDLTRAAERLLKKMGFDCATVDESVRQSAGVYTVRAVQRIGGVPTFSAEMTLTYTNGVLSAMEGVFYTGSSDAQMAEETPCIACTDALIAFLNSRETLGWVGSRIVSIEQGYSVAEMASASTVRLNPVWRIETDTAVYEVNGLDGTVSAA